jgi:predicted amidohydrolase
VKLVLVQPQLHHDAGAGNLDVIRSSLDTTRADLGPGDVIVLPERFEMREDAAVYQNDVAGFARDFGCHVVGGSHHERRGGSAINAGIVVDPRGNILERYEKLRPYALERQFVEPGTRIGELIIDGHHLLILICADFWFVDLILRATRAPDLVVVPALSVTRKSTPDYSRSLWRHLAISRAYEFGAYVGISDWAYPSHLPIMFTSGAGGFADPTVIDPARFFTPVPSTGVAVHDVDFGALDAFRRDRRARGFFWK